MNRDFTVVRRRDNLVDIVTAKRAGIQGYRLKAALNFDATFQTLFTGDISTGHLDRAIDTRLLTSLNNRDRVRLVFDPATYSAGPWNLVDTDHFWLRFFPVDFAGAEGAGGARVLVLPYDEMQAQGRVIIRGDAPIGAGPANALRLDLPSRMKDIYIRSNEVAGGNFMAVSATPGGSEQLINPGETARFLEGSVESLLVRSDTGAVNFTATMTNALPL